MNIQKSDTYWGENDTKETPKKNDDGGDKKEPPKSDQDLILTDCINHLYYYDNVDKPNGLKFITKLRQLDEKLWLKKLKGELDDPTIHIHFNSPGGSLLQGFSMASAVRSTKCSTVGHAEGCVASAITLPWICCNKRTIQTFSYALIHQLSSSFWGTAEDFKDNQKNLDEFMRQIIEIYKKFTSVPEDEIEEILKHDIFWNSETCLKYKLVDEIVG